MNSEFDPSKDESNLDKHGLSLAEVSGFEWETAMVREDTHRQYPEQRFEATGYIGNRLHVMLFCLRGCCARHQPAQGQPKRGEKLG